MKTRWCLKTLFLGVLLILCAQQLFAEASFEATSDGVRYVVRDASGRVSQSIKPEFDPATGRYLVKDSSN